MMRNTLDMLAIGFMIVFAAALFAANLFMLGTPGVLELERIWG